MAPKPYIAAPYYPGVPLDDQHAKVLLISGHYQVREYTCGFASALTVLRYFQRPISPEEIYRTLGTDHEGTSQGALLRALRESGIRANPRYSLTFDDYCNFIDNNKLVIGYHHRLDHWVVVYGYGRHPERVFIAESIKHWRREHAWEDYGPKLNGFGIVCSHKPMKLMPRATPPRGLPILKRVT